MQKPEMFTWLCGCKTRLRSTQILVDKKCKKCGDLLIPVIHLSVRAQDKKG